MKIYARKIDNQCITHQIAYTKEILNDFLGGLSNNDVIICEGKTTHQRYEVTILTATDDRFNSNMKTLLDAEGTMEVGDLMVMYKRARNEYIVELVKPGDEKYQTLISMFAENDRHLLLQSDDGEFEIEPTDEELINFKKMLAFFVKQLSINNRFAGFEDGEPIWVQGNWAKSSTLVEEWNTFRGFSLKISMPSGYRKSQFASNYLFYGWVNINPVFNFEESRIDGVYVRVLPNKNVKYQGEVYSVEELNLFSDENPNERIKTLFIELSEQIKKWNDGFYFDPEIDRVDNESDEVVLVTDDTFEISEDGFREWLANNKLKPNGEHLSEEYQNGYFYLIKALPSMFGIEDLFSITSLNKLNKIIESLKETETYNDANIGIGNRQMNSAISAFVEYFSEQTNEIIPQEGLIEILKNWMINTPVASNKTSSIVGFGFKYAVSLNEQDIKSTDLLRAAGVEDSLSNCIDRGKDLYFAISNNSIGFSFVEKPKKTKLIFKTGFPVFYNNETNCILERNRILFGAPGTGKSHDLEEDRKTFVKNGGEYERVTFHPDYTYAQFVGSYKPQMKDNGDIEYKYTPGPFMRTLVKAYKSGMSSNPHGVLLIIEEINRANMAAVFGDTFQLLDRDKDGVSEYAICVSEDMKGYLRQELGFFVDEIKLPDNFYVWATMNSADQGVFPMDTAFKRRWNFEYIGIDDGEDELKDENNNEYVYTINGETIVWNELRKSINIWMASEGINEDKQLGPFFISKNHLDSINEKENKDELFMNAFKDKVLMYLFEDACRSRRERLFSDNTNKKRYSVICEDFAKIGIKIFNSDIVKNYNNFFPTA